MKRVSDFSIFELLSPPLSGWVLWEDHYNVAFLKDTLGCVNSLLWSEAQAARLKDNAGGRRMYRHTGKVGC